LKQGQGKSKAEKPADKTEETPALPEAAEGEAAKEEEVPKAAEPEVAAPAVEEAPVAQQLETTPAVTAAA
jgi:hypothetical protein